MKGAQTPCPDPYLRPERGPVYYFSYNDPRTGKRTQRSTRCANKEQAIREIKKYLDRLENESSDIVDVPFAEYAAPFFLDGQCPRQMRLLDDGSSFGQRHMKSMRDGLERVIGRPTSAQKEAWTPLPFSTILLGRISRSDGYALRRSLSKKPGGRTGQLAFQAVKTVLSEAVEQGILIRNG